jgi:aldehyde dehydrogenase (NAD+)
MVIAHSTIKKQYDYDLYINGKWQPSSSNRKEEVINPASEEVIGRAAVGNVNDVDSAIAAARKAFDHGPWSKLTPKERSAKMFDFYAALKKREAEIVELIIAETGATRPFATSIHVATPLEGLEYWAEAAARNPMTPLPVKVNPGPGGSKVLGAGVTVRLPKGVVGAISAYNFPFFLSLGKVGPALAMGNTVVLKPSPFTPLCSFILAEAAAEADLPEGVLNIVTGGVDVGEKISSDPRVDMITFTGSDLVGAKVMEQASATLKSVHLELGGKSPLIVRHDANLDKVIPAAIGALTTQSGQGCALATRHLVHNSLKDEYIKRLKAGLEKVKVGNPTDPSVTMGPLIREKQYESVNRYVQNAVKAGATVVTGGARPEGLEKGFYYLPTLLTDVDNSWEICQDELFGPVGVVIGFDTDEEAIQIANDSKYGLSGQIFSADVGTAFEMSLKIRSGQTSINGGYGAFNILAPFGGLKRSGIGREWGEEGLNEFTEVKAIMFHGE